MSDQQPQMSRRDWFRLRRPNAVNPQSTEAEAKRPDGRTPDLGNAPSDRMNAVSEPVNHGGVDLSELPPMHEAILSQSDIQALFSDLEEHASNIQLIARSRSAGPAGDHSPQLDQACQRLLSGEVRKMQVRYEWQQARWIDTFELQESGIRLVRIKHG